VLDSTLLAVRHVLLPYPQPLRDIAEAINMEKNTVRDALNLLIRLGLAEKIEHEPRESDKKGGWVTVEYRLITTETKVIETKVINSITIEKEP